ncbi:MAG: hypothetical protein ACLVI7_01485 [Hominilimicola sp.]
MATEKVYVPETVKARYIRYNGDGATDPDKNYCHISEIAVLGAEEEKSGRQADEIEKLA